MNFALFGRFFLEFAMMYPAEYLCLASLQEHLRAPRKTYAIGASAITLMGLAGAPTGKYRSARPCFCSQCRR